MVFNVIFQFSPNDFLLFKSAYLTFKNQIALFSLFDGVISDVAKTLPNAGLSFQKLSIHAGFRRFCNHSHSIVAGGLEVIS